MPWDLGPIFSGCTWPFLGECVAEMPYYRYQPQTAALFARSLRCSKASAQSPDMDEHDGIPAFEPTTTSSQAKVSTETTLRTGMDVPPVSLLEIPTGHSPETGSCIVNLPRCQKHIIGTRYRGILRHLRPSTMLAVILVQPITAAAAPIRFDLQMTVEDAQPTEEMGRPTLPGFRMSSAWLLLCYFAFSGVAAGLVYLQRSNPHLKHAFLVCSAALFILAFCKGTELMLEILPWAFIGMLLVTGLHYTLVKVSSGTMTRSSTCQACQNERAGISGYPDKARREEAP